MPDFIGVDHGRVAGLKQALVEEVERHAGASDDLRVLAECLRNLRDDDPLWLAYARAIESDGLRSCGWLSGIIEAGWFRGSPREDRELLREFLQVMAQAA